MKNKGRVDLSEQSSIIYRAQFNSEDLEDARHQTQRVPIGNKELKH